VCSKCGAEAPAPAEEVPEVVKGLNTEMVGIAQQYLDLLEGLKIRDAVGKALQASSAGNKFLQVWLRPLCVSPHPCTLLPLYSADEHAGI
jgi:hypothetical protein